MSSRIVEMAASASAAGENNFYKSNDEAEPPSNFAALLSLTKKNTNTYQSEKFTIYASQTLFDELQARLSKGIIHALRGYNTNNIIYPSKEIQPIRDLVDEIIPLRMKEQICTGLDPKFIIDQIFMSNVVILLRDEDTPKEDIAGIATITINLEVPTVDINLICSSKSYKGAGRLLMMKISEIAIRSGIEKLRLQSVPTECTLAFYKKQGFKRMRDEADPYVKKALEEDLIPMARKVVYRRKKMGGTVVTKKRTNKRKTRKAGSKN